MVGRLHGKIALVTGASGGIGEAVCRRLATEGAHVVAGVHDIGAAKFAQPDIEAVQLDVGDPGAILKCLGEIFERHGCLDVLVNAAGTMPFVLLTETEPEDWTKAFDVDLIGPFMLCREMLRRKGSGSIVNIASIHATAVEPQAAIYAASKAALLSLTRSVAIEGRASKIRANVVLPGAVDTPMLWDNPNVRSGAEKIDPAEIGKPDQIAGLVAFLASDDAEFINGASITIDGGRMAHL